MKIIMIWLLLMLILGLLTTNVFRYRELRKYYALLYNSQLDPIGLSYFQEATDQTTRDKPTVVFYGDSRAAQWIAPQTDVYAIINRGIGNQTSAPVLLRFEEHIQPLQPDAIILQVCVNDLKTIPLFPDSKDEIIAACENNIEAIIQKSRGLDSVVILRRSFPRLGMFRSRVALSGQTKSMKPSTGSTASFGITKPRASSFSTRRASFRTLKAT